MITFNWLLPHVHDSFVAFTLLRLETLSFTHVSSRIQRKTPASSSRYTYTNHYLRGSFPSVTHPQKRDIETMERNPSETRAREAPGENNEGCDHDIESSKNIMMMKNERKVLMEEAFLHTAVPPWTKQITIRSMVTSFLLSVVFNFIVCKLNLTTGVIPSLNVAAGLLGFAVVKGYTTLLHRAGVLKQPFTRQENTVIQTCVVASSGIAFSSTY